MDRRISTLRWSAAIRFPVLLGVWLLLSDVPRLSAREAPGLSPQRVEELSARLRGHVDRGELPGILSLVWLKGRTVHLQVHGQSDLARSVPLREDTIFRIYSMTKPITTVAALLLVEEGRLHLDDRVSTYLPVFETMRVYQADAPDGSRRSALERPVTIRDLLRHTSGLTYGYSTSTPVDALYHEARILDRKGTLADMIVKLERLPLRNQPGGEWHYGLSTDVLGRVVEVVSGRPLDAFCAERIFRPLGMVDTGFAVSKAKRDRLAGIYAFSGGKLAPWGGSVETTTYHEPVTFFSGGGGAVSTAPDYLRFARMLLDGGRLGDVRLLRPETVALMTTNQLNGEFRPGWGYGFGVQVATDVERSGQPGSKGSYGWAGGGNTFFFVDPSEGLIGMVWTQLSGPSPISREFREGVYQALREGRRSK